MPDPETLCVIPARGGSRGLPRKNVALLGGDPLVGIAVDVARQAQRVDRVVVSTDDSVIAAAALAAGAEVIARPEELAGDEADSESALLHVLETLDRDEGYHPDLLVFLQCTAPLTLSEDVDGTVATLLAEAADTALAVAPSHRFLWRVSETGLAEGINHEAARRLRRQDREPEWVEAGSVYVMRADRFREVGHRFFGHTVLHSVPAERVLEVDDRLDLDWARSLLPMVSRRNKVSRLPSRVSAVVLDFDGVLTDNAVIVNQDGTESVRCHRGDGMGIERIQEAGIPVMVLSRERNPVVAARCEKLGVPCVQGLMEKRATLMKWLGKRSIRPEEVVFVGNDVNDRDCLEAVGCPVVVADAHPDIIPLARLRLDHAGGQGAVRELTDLIEMRLQETTY